MPDWDPETFTRDLVADMRAHGGVPTKGPFNGRQLIILTTTGARSGATRTALLAYRREGNRIVIAGSKGGAPADPAWVHNLRARPTATAEVNNEVFGVEATIEANGPERDRLWAAHVAEMPGFGAYLTKTERVIPMIVLERTN